MGNHLQHLDQHHDLKSTNFLMLITLQILANSMLQLLHPELSSLQPNITKLYHQITNMSSNWVLQRLLNQLLQFLHYHTLIIQDLISTGVWRTQAYPQRPSTMGFLLITYISVSTFY